MAGKIRNLFTSYSAFNMGEVQLKSLIVNMYLMIKQTQNNHVAKF